MSTYICGIIEESLKNKDFLHKIIMYHKKERVQEMPDEVEKVWHIHEYELPSNILLEVFSSLQEVIKAEWYIHTFNEEENVLYVILKGKYFKLPCQRDESWEKMISYGLTVSVDRRWTENIPMGV